MELELFNNNRAYIAGVIDSEPKFSHETYGENFYDFNIKVKRLSENCDIIPVTISEKILNNDIKPGNKFACFGQFRSYNKVEDEKSRLILTMFVKEVVPYNEELNPNNIDITGYICKEPVFRTTPFKREICDVLIAVNRTYNKSDYLPCIAWGKNAKYIKDLGVGEKVKLNGRIQSRVYQKRLNDGSIVERVAYEISLNKVNVLGYKNNKIDSQNEASIVKMQPALNYVNSKAM